jgi:fructosamine-3-kinase
VAEFIGLLEEPMERLAGGDLSEVLLVRRPDGRLTVAKGSSSAATEAAMLRALAAAGVPAPLVEAEHQSVLLLEHIENDGLFSPKAWADVGAAMARLHAQTADLYGWPSDYALGTVQLDNRQSGDWAAFWGEQRLISTANLLDRPWRERIERLALRLGELIPATPPASLLHGDLWSGNILVRDGALAALIDPACFHGHAEVDLAMLTVFDAPPDSFWEAYGEMDAGWRERRPVYQLFPALVHLRLFGSSYAGLADRLLTEIRF